MISHLTRKHLLHSIFIWCHIFVYLLLAWCCWELLDLLVIPYNYTCVCYIKAQISKKMQILSMTVHGLEIEQCTVQNQVQQYLFEQDHLCMRTGLMHIMWLFSLSWLLWSSWLSYNVLTRLWHTAPGIRCIHLSRKLHLQRQDRVGPSQCCV